MSQCSPYMFNESTSKVRYEQKLSQFTVCFSYIGRPETHWKRRVSWIIILLLGSTFSFILIKKNAQKYYRQTTYCRIFEQFVFSYPSFMKEESDHSFVTEFPKITVCLNSMHSLGKLQRFYPELVHIIRPGLILLLSKLLTFFS